MKNYIFIFSLLFIFILTGNIILTYEPFHKSSSQISQEDNEYEKILSKYHLTDKMEKAGVPGISIAIIKNGKIDWAKGYGLLQKGKEEGINKETLFSVGSVSKVGTAVMILKLKEEGILNIDVDVNQYLKSWKIPENSFTKKQVVTLRHILSHTAGLTVHGFADFEPNEELPTSVQILNGEWPAKNSAIYVNIPVGSQYRYSGGGTQVEQLVIEDLTGLSFHEAAEKLLFQPLEMTRSSYENPIPNTTENIAKAHDRNGRPVALPRGYQSMPEAAASGLWTTPSDFAKLMIMLMDAYESNSSFLSQKNVQDMMKPVPPSQYGLGPRIESNIYGTTFSHGGSNESYKAQFGGLLDKKNGIIIFANSSAGFDIIEEIFPLFESLLFEEK